MNIYDILKYNKQINDERLKYKDLAYNILSLLINTVNLDINDIHTTYLEDENAALDVVKQRILDYLNIYENIFDWDLTSYLEIFENTYLKTGIIFYIRNFNNNEDLIEDKNKLEDNKKYIADRPEKVLRHFNLILINNSDNVNDRSILQLKNIIRDFFKSKNIKDDKNVTYISDSIPNDIDNENQHIYKLTGSELNKIIEDSSNMYLEDQYYSSVEELNLNIDNIVNKFNELILNYCNSDKLEEIHEDINKIYNNKLNKLYIISVDNERNPLTAPIDIPFENHIFSEMDKEKILEYTNNTNE